MTRRTSTKRQLEDAPELYEQILARLVEPEWLEGSAESGWKPPKPWQVLVDMGMSWGAFWAYVSSDADRLARFNATMAARAMLLAEQTIELADDVEEDKNAIAKVRLQQAARQFYAESWDKPHFGRVAKAEGGGGTGAMVDAALLGVAAELLKQIKAPAHRVLEHAPARALQPQQYEDL